MRYELTASTAGVSCVMKTITQPPAMIARASRKVAVVRRSAGNAGAIIGTRTNSGELMTSGDDIRNENVPVVAARKSSAGAGRIVPVAATDRMTASDRKSV